MNVYSTTKSLHQVEDELRTLQFEMLQKRRERKYDEVENLERLVDDLQIKVVSLKKESRSEVEM